MKRPLMAWSTAVALSLPMLAATTVAQPATAAAALPSGVTAPADVDPAIAGTQVKASIPNQPAFLLTAGNDNWRVSNSALGTVAFGYGHEDLAATSTLQTASRMGVTTTTTTGTVSPTRRLLDSTVEAADPAHGRTASWIVSRYSDGSVDVKSVGQKPLLRFSIGPAAGAPPYVGGVVTSDQGGTGALIALVTSTGTVSQFAGTAGKLGAVSGTFSIGKAAVAAVPRSYANPAVGQISLGPGAPAAYQVKDFRDASRPNTLLMVLAADGDLIPFTVGSTESTGSVPAFYGLRQYAGLTSLRAVLNAATPPTAANALLDFDWSCMTAANDLVSWDDAMGFAAGGIPALGCTSVAAQQDGLDRLSLGRISVAVADASVPGGAVKVYTAGDFDDDTDGDGLWVNSGEVRAETGCTAQSPAVITPGSFDLRVVSGVTHLACVQKEATTTSGVRVANYSYPASESVKEFQLPARTSATAVEYLDNTLVNIEPDSSDPGPGVPVPDSGMKKTYFGQINYGSPFQPTIQLQFPCAELLSQKLGASTALDDCDASTGYAPGASDPATGKTQVAPPSNWMSYTIAGYTQNSNGRQLVVMNAPATVTPADRTKRRADTPPAVPAHYTVDNLSSIAPVPIYYGDDINRLNTGQDVDLAGFNRYAADASQPVFLAQIPQPSSYEVELTIDTANWQHEKDATGFPVAVLQAPPHVAGLGQDTLFTPTMQDTYATRQEKSTDASFSQGWHQSLQVSMTGGVPGAGKLKGSIEEETHGEYAAERELGASVDVHESVGFGGSFDDTTVVLRAYDVYRFPGKVIKDPTGLALGAAIPYDVLRTNSSGQGIVTQVNRKLADLAAEFPRVYGEHGMFRNSIDRMLNDYTVGDPGTYFEGGTDTPANILQANGGPCKGGYQALDQPDTYFKALDVISRDNPFLAPAPAAPTGPSVLVSKSFGVDWGSDLATTGELGKAIETSSSLHKSSSFGFGVTAGLSITVGEDDVAAVEAEAKAGFDLGWSTGSGTSTSMSTETSFQVINTGIPYKASDVGDWVKDETYNYQMFVCKAPIGASSVGNDVWLMGYLTDSYSPRATGGITDLAEVSATSPTNGAAVLSIPGGDTSGWLDSESEGTAEPCVKDSPTQVQLKWDQAEGTVKDYVLEVRDTTSGSYKGHHRTYTMPKDGFAWDTPQESKAVAERPSCVAIPASDLISGHNYEWNITIEGFVQNKVSLTTKTGPQWAAFNPRSTPENAKITLRTPQVNSDGSMTVGIVDPAGFGPLKHEVRVYDATGKKLLTTVREGGTAVRTRPLAVGDYLVRVRAYNGVQDTNGNLLYSPEVTTRVRVSGLKVTKRPAISGKAKVGKKLTVKPGTTAPGATAITRQWLRNGRPIRNATRPTYKLVKADKGKAVSVRVTFRRAGYVTATVTTRSVKVRR